MSEEIIVRSASSVSPHEGRFILLMLKVKQPITEEQIVQYFYDKIWLRDCNGNFYNRYVVRNPSYQAPYGIFGYLETVQREGFPPLEKIYKHLKPKALDWYDKWLGRCIRKGLPFIPSRYALKGNGEIMLLPKSEDGVSFVVDSNLPKVEVIVYTQGIEDFIPQCHL